MSVSRSSGGDDEVMVTRLSARVMMWSVVLQRK